MKNILLYLLLISFIVGCSDRKPLVYESDNVEFNLPSGWLVKDAKQVSATTEMIILQNGEYIPKGVFSITVFDDYQDRNAVINFYQDRLRSQDVGMVETTSIFDEVVIDTFGIYETISSDYNMEVIGVKSKAELHVFHTSNKTIVLQLQSVRGEEEILKAGIVALESSLRIKE